MTGADWQESFRGAAVAFRLGREGEASQRLVQGIDQLVASLGSLPAERVGLLQRELNETLQAQQRKDFLRVADLLEYVLLPLCRG